jgi:hypothetical protein
MVGRRESKVNQVLHAVQEITKADSHRGSPPEHHPRIPEAGSCELPGRRQSPAVPLIWLRGGGAAQTEKSLAEGISR